MSKILTTLANGTPREVEQVKEVLKPDIVYVYELGYSEKMERLFINVDWKKGKDYDIENNKLKIFF